MSDYNIYSIPSYTIHNVDCKIESVGDDSFVIIEEQSPSPSFPVGPFDIVKVTVSQNGVKKIVFGVYEDQSYDGLDFRLTCGFDSNVYGDFIEAETDVEKLEYYPLPSSAILSLSSYSLIPTMSVATYGKSYNVYNVQESYNITAPKERIVFNSNTRALYSAEEKVLVDSCSGKAYKVSPTELSAVAFAGKITTALNFNVLIK